MKKPIYSIGYFLSFFILCWLKSNNIEKRHDKTRKISEKQQTKSVNDFKTKIKYVLVLNWKEFHKEKQKIVTQNEYRGDLQGYEEEPFKGNSI